MTDDQQVRDEDAEQLLDWGETFAGAAAVAKGASAAAEAAGGETIFGLALGEGAGIAGEAAVTGGELLAGDAIGMSAAIVGDVAAGTAAASEVAAAATFAVAAAPVVAGVALGMAVVYGVDYLTDGALREGAAAAGEAIDWQGDVAKLRAREQEAPEAPGGFNIPDDEDQ